jgi:hypothetical protein
MFSVLLPEATSYESTKWGSYGIVPWDPRPDASFLHGWRGIAQGTMVEGRARESQGGVLSPLARAR